MGGQTRGRVDVERPRGQRQLLRRAAAASARTRRTRTRRPIYYGRLLFVTFFNAGLRVLDIRDPYSLKEVAYYIPATTDKTDERCIGEGAQERCKIAIQSNNAEVDDRGYIYIGDRANTGLHILELTGAARRVANFPGQSTAQR